MKLSSLIQPARHEPGSSEIDPAFPILHVNKRRQGRSNGPTNGKAVTSEPQDQGSNLGMLDESNLSTTEYLRIPSYEQGQRYQKKVGETICGRPGPSWPFRTARRKHHAGAPPARPPPDSPPAPG